MKAAAIDRFGPPSVLKLHELPVAEEARLQVPIAAKFPLAQAARAHERLERGSVIGRIVLRIARRR